MILTLQIVYNWISILIVSIILHELGHYWFAGKYARIIYDRKNGLRIESTIISNYQKVRCWFAGIFIGAIFISIASIVNIIYATIFILYIVGCWDDIKQIWRSIVCEKK